MSRLITVRDASIYDCVGVFVPWGPQSSGRRGDWYARKLYREGEGPSNNHRRNFGHPSEFGYKDVLNAWKAPKRKPAR